MSDETKTMTTTLGGSVPAEGQPNQTPAAAPDPKPAEGQQTGAEDWRTTLPDSWKIKTRNEAGEDIEILLRDHPVLGKYPNKDEAVKALVHAQTLLGQRKDGAKRPGPDAKDEDWAAYRAAQGVPEKPEEYDLGLDKMELPLDADGKPAVNPDVVAQFQKTAHELGLSPEQVQGLANWFLPWNMAELQNGVARVQEIKQAEFQELRKTYGERTKQVLDDAHSAVLALGGDDLLRVLDETTAGNRRVVIDAFAKVAPLLGESKAKGTVATPATRLTEPELRAMMRDERYTDPMRRDPAFVKRVEDGFKALYGDSPSDTRG